MDRPALLPAQLEALEQPEHPALAVAHPEPRLDQGAQVAGAPGHAAVAPQVRAAQDQRLERGLLPLVQGAGSAGTGPVAQAGEALNGMDGPRLLHHTVPGARDTTRGDRSWQRLRQSGWIWQRTGSRYTPQMPRAGRSCARSWRGARFSSSSPTCRRA